MNAVLGSRTEPRQSSSALTVNILTTPSHASTLLNAYTWTAYDDDDDDEDDTSIRELGESSMSIDGVPASATPHLKYESRAGERSEGDAIAQGVEPQAVVLCNQHTHHTHTHTPQREGRRVRRVGREGGWVGGWGEVRTSMARE
jgi:hypothetical protein